MLEVTLGRDNTTPPPLSARSCSSVPFKSSTGYHSVWGNKKKKGNKNGPSAAAQPSDSGTSNVDQLDALALDGSLPRVRISTDSASLRGSGSRPTGRCSDASSGSEPSQNTLASTTESLLLTPSASSKLSVTAKTDAGDDLHALIRMPLSNRHDDDEDEDHVILGAGSKLPPNLQWLNAAGAVASGSSRLGHDRADAQDCDQETGSESSQPSRLQLDSNPLQSQATTVSTGVDSGNGGDDVILVMPQSSAKNLTTNDLWADVVLEARDGRSRGGSESSDPSHSSYSLGGKLTASSLV